MSGPGPYGRIASLETLRGLLLALNIIGVVALMGAAFGNEDGLLFVVALVYALGTWATHVVLGAFVTILQELARIRDRDRAATLEAQQ